MRLTVDVVGRTAMVIATSLFALQSGLFLAGRVVDLVAEAEVAYGFILTMLTFAAGVFAGARSVHMPPKRAAFRGWS